MCLHAECLANEAISHVFSLVVFAVIWCIHSCAVYTILCTAGLSQWPSSSANSYTNQGSEVAAIHSKLDQLIAVYTMANTPRGGPVPDSIFSAASDARTAPAAPGPSLTAASDAQVGGSPNARLNTAESIVPGGKVAAIERSLDDGRADDKLGMDAALSPKGGADSDTALDPAAATSGAEPIRTASRVRFSLANLIIEDDSSSKDAEGGSAAAAEAQVLPKAASTETDGTADSQQIPRQSAWSRLRDKAASNDSGAGNSSEAAVDPQVVVCPSVPTIRSSLKSPKPGNTGNAVSSTLQHNSVPEAASTSAAAAAPEEEAASPAAMPSAPVPSVAAELDRAGGRPQPLVMPSVKPRSSFQRMLRRVLQ